VSWVWPFETGFTTTPISAPGPWVLHAEIWPSISPQAYDPSLPIKDQAQVRAVVQWLRQADRDGLLAVLFGSPHALPAIGVEAATAEEGWIVGAGATGARQRVRRQPRHPVSSHPGNAFHASQISE
jgi:hypothetical protein